MLVDRQSHERCVGEVVKIACGQTYWSVVKAAETSWEAIAVLECPTVFMVMREW